MVLPQTADLFGASRRLILLADGRSISRVAKSMSCILDCSWRIIDLLTAHTTEQYIASGAIQLCVTLISPGRAASVWRYCEEQKTSFVVGMNSLRYVCRRLVSRVLRWRVSSGRLIPRRPYDVEQLLDSDPDFQPRGNQPGGHHPPVLYRLLWSLVGFRGAEHVAGCARLFRGVFERSAS